MPCAIQIPSPGFAFERGEYCSEARGTGLMGDFQHRGRGRPHPRVGLTAGDLLRCRPQVELNAAAIAAALNDKGSLALRNILFDTGKATLKPESSTELQLVVEVLKADESLRLEIQGHTDNVGPSAANLTLSQQRAAAVRDYLVKTGSNNHGVNTTHLAAFFINI